MASITQLTQDGRLIDDWRKINTNFTNLNNDKAEKSTTLSGYGITDAYDKTTMDEKLAEAGKVKTVNGEAPDTDGNIQITVGGHEIVDELPSVEQAEDHTVYFLEEADDSTSVYTKAEIDSTVSNINTQLSSLSSGKVDKANPKEINGYSLDTIVAQGTNYIRYNNGVQICWGYNMQDNVPLTKAWGNLYINEGTACATNFPVEFIDIPNISFDVGMSSSSCWVITSNQSKTGFSIQVARGNSATIAVRCKYIAIGRWK